ncbi:hypothetical protein L0436_000027 [Salmonella enterica]|uniref:Uncharacterized protein n=1 Tax=Salmonella enterica subsp. enterica serovar Poona TaxID=436295 RepID=A0A5V6NME3_SALET|nr:hypothetical protein [Salmonella enterica]EAA7481391.1 hypothetical protein [Salmonella enterica subsp. enterica serovar Irumu]EAA7723901.1 hypothetical protein [Salmonella enterica subsp. enterica serovar Pomona]EAC2150014.1 hypothetical protein [Salmonella enterica subsp. enterica]EBH7932223.1 hypothetical protein [Salmonella enterica subsp. enterica serovar Rubislaw]EBL6563132.1 hypothetical protein [Salmonella enterica subsp. enterica serovar Muenchen]EBS4388329.1 hypothetical protein 
MQENELRAAIAANRQPATPEQVLIWVAEFEAAIDKADRNTRHNEKARALEPLRSLCRQKKEWAMKLIHARRTDK